MTLHMLFDVMIFSTVMPGPTWIRPRPTAGCGDLGRKVESGRHSALVVSQVYIIYFEATRTAGKGKEEGS